MNNASVFLPWETSYSTKSDKDRGRYSAVIVLCNVSGLTLKISFITIREVCGLLYATEIPQ